MDFPYLDKDGLQTLWGFIKDRFGIKIDSQTIAVFANLGWDPPSDSDEASDWDVDQEVITQYEDLGWEE